MEKGWVKSHRQILDNIFLMHDNNAFMVFTKLLLLVNRKTGQLATGRNSLGEQVNLNPRTLYDVLIRLENQQIINITSNNRYSVITICNWEKYQNDPTTEPTSSQQLANIQPTTRQHSNKKKEVRIKNSNSKELAKPVYGNPEINEMFEYWQETIGYKLESNITRNRNACNNLIKKHGKDGVMRLVQGVAQAKQDQYAPRIADYSQLQTKYNDLISWGQAKSNGSKAKVAKI